MARILAVAVILVTVVADQASARESPLTRAQLTARAFTICAQASNGIARVRPAFTLADSADATAAVLVHLRRASRLLGRLPASPADAPLLRRYVRLLNRQISAMQRAERAARRKDRSGFRSAYLTAGGISLQARRAADQLGLSVCGTL